MPRKPYYGVANGRSVGVFETWSSLFRINNREDCEASVKGFSKAVYKGFNSRGEATSFIAGYTRKMRQLADAQIDRAQARQSLGSSLTSPPFEFDDVEQGERSGADDRERRVPTRSYERVELYVESDDDDDLDGERAMDAGFPYFAGDTPTQVVYPYLPSRKRPSPNTTGSANKKANPMPIQIIDLTESPPKDATHTARYSDNIYPSLSTSRIVSTRYQPIDLEDIEVDNMYPSKSCQSTYRSPHQFQAAQAERYAAIRSEKYRPYSDETDDTSPELDYCPDVPVAQMSPEQKHILDLVSQGKNVFFTGSAGVGKSFVLQKICDQFNSKGLRQFEDFFITASTGIAAVHVGGMTVHSFAGCGKGEEGITDLQKRIERNKRSRKHWTECKTLIIDEVSMLSDDLFDKLDQIGQHLRKSDKPFGGIQLVLCGDFYQLPPVPPEKRRCPQCGGFNPTQRGDKLECTGRVDDTDHYSPLCKTVFNKKIGYIFQSEAWKRAKFEIIELTTIYRQSDSEFVTALNKARLGKPDTNTLRLFNACQRPLTHMLEIKPTKMYPIRALVQHENSREFNALDTKIYTYNAIDSQSSPDQHTPDYTSVLSDLQAPKELKLRVGAQVMLLANLGFTAGLVNGTRGVVTGFAGMEEALAYAQLEGAMRGKGDEAGAEVKGFARGQDMEFPRVLFETKDTTKEVIVTPYTWRVALGYRLEVSRVQIPLMTAWALTIHKCQGMTLDKCVLHLERCFGFGMAYVALSRCKSLEGLQIVGWKGGKEIRADPVVEGFYKSIRSGER